ncbi:MAG: AI-2E family transporter [Sutterella wadsworthensis]
MTDDQQPAPGAAERRRSTARSAAAKRVRGDFVAQIPKRFSEGFTERIDLIIRIVFMVVVAVGCYLVLEPFLTAILIAAVLAVVTWPVFNKLRSGMRQSSTAAASVMVLSIVVLVLIPLSFLLVALAQQVPRGCRPQRPGRTLPILRPCRASLMRAIGFTENSFQPSIRRPLHTQCSAFSSRFPRGCLTPQSMSARASCSSPS